MVPQDLANTMWAYATLGRAPEPETRRALETAAARVASSMNPQALANTVWSYAKLGRAPEPETWRALETAAVRVAASMVPQALANTVWAYATLGRAPEPETWRALETGTARVAPSMNPQALANTVWAYATLGRAPDTETWRALETGTARVAPSMNPQNLANTLWAYTSLSSLRDVILSSSYAALWELVRNMEESDFIAEGQTMLFHAHLMHQSFLSSRAPTNISTPPWLLVEARDAWMSQSHDDVTVSRSQRELAQNLDKLGVRHEVEYVTEDGYFSIDIYLPDHDIAVEFDGPSHYYSSGSSSPGCGDGTTTKNAKTELRDLFLGQRCTKVLTVPWFEFSKFNASEVKRTSYVRELLAKEGIVV
jgi:cellobiose-specific phosphotransferase system component IIA